MPSEEKAMLIMPAHNEQDSIASVVADAIAIKKQGAIIDFVVVENGSQDNTAQIAREAGANVISFQANEKPGKGEAFMKGILYAKNNGATAIIMADADQQDHLTKKNIDDMLAFLNYNRALGRVIHPQMNGESHVPWAYSGHYAIRLSALDFLFEKGEGGKYAFSASDVARAFFDAASGYGLEVALSYAINSEKETWVLAAGAIRCKPYKNGEALKQQQEAISIAMVKGMRFRELLAKMRQASLVSPNLKEAGKEKLGKVRPF
ncbi:MAG: glycosyltransferase [Candidatus Micrarchaeota archaeon]|nr:glycosyltransferase [Candidatus Micrarchaeota archaeon]